MTTKKVSKLDEILAKNESKFANVVRKGATIYKPELFDGLNKDEKKSQRIKLRRIRERYEKIHFQIENNKDENKQSLLNDLRKEFLNYAKEVYVDVTKLIDSNTSVDGQRDTERFLNFLFPPKKEKETSKK